MQNDLGTAVRDYHRRSIAAIAGFHCISSETVTKLLSQATISDDDFKELSRAFKGTGELIAMVLEAMSDEGPQQDVQFAVEMLAKSEELRSHVAADEFSQLFLSSREQPFSGPLGPLMRTEDEASISSDDPIRHLGSFVTAHAAVPDFLSAWIVEVKRHFADTLQGTVTEQMHWEPSLRCLAARMEYELSVVVQQVEARLSDRETGLSFDPNKRALFVDGEFVHCFPERATAVCSFLLECQQQSFGDEVAFSGDRWLDKETDWFHQQAKRLGSILEDTGWIIAIDITSKSPSVVAKFEHCQLTDSAPTISVS